MMTGAGQSEVVAGALPAESYDALGRLAAVWLPGNSTSGQASMKFAYTVSQDAP